MVTNSPPTEALSSSTALVTPGPEAEAPAHALRRQGLERLDLLLLCVEALDLNGGETLLWMGQHLGLAPLFPNRVALWKLRSHNPLRRADRVYPIVRGLLSSREPADVNQQHWQLFQQRLTELLRERMNMRRSSVQTLMDPEQGAADRRALIQTLALAAGSGGVDRLRASLLDAAL
jgi:hypothetical protein